MAVDINRIIFAAREYRQLETEDAQVKTRHPLSSELTYNTFLANSADAASFGADILELMKRPRFTWTLRVARKLYTGLVLGQTITVKHPRFGLSEGKDFIVKRIRLDTSQMFVDLSLFGPLQYPLHIYSTYSVALDFADQAYWVSGTESDLASMTGYSFSRTGSQGAVDSDLSLDFYSANIPAINNRGFHSYGSLTNPIKRSSELDHSDWNKSGATVSANVAVGPDGTTSLDKLIASAVGERHHAYQVHGYTGASVTFTVSAIVKADGVGFSALGITNGAGAWNVIQFNLSTGAVVGSYALIGANPTAGYAVDLGGGFWRLVVTFVNYNVDATASVAVVIMATGGGDAIFEGFAGNGTNGILVGHLQSLGGHFPDGGPFISTEASSASIGGSSLSTTVNPISVDTTQDFIWWGVADLEGPADGSTLSVLSSMGGASAYIARLDSGAFTINDGAGDISAGSWPAGRGVVLMRRRAGKTTLGYKTPSNVITVGAESAARTFGSVNTTLRLGNHSIGGHETDGALEGVFLRQGTFSDADLTEILTDA